MKKLSVAQVKQKLKQIPKWKKKGKIIWRKFEFKNFRQAIKFVNNIVPLAEHAGHHPDIFIHNYRKVVVSVTTHDAGGLTKKDFDLAKKIDRINI